MQNFRTNPMMSLKRTMGRRNIMKGMGLLGLAGLFSGTSAAREEEEREQERDQDDDDEKGVDRHGPMRTGRFTVQIDEVEIEGWRSITIPSTSTEQGTYREGNDAEYERKLIDPETLDDLEMERGVKPGDSVILDWRRDVIVGEVDEGRKEVAVTLEDDSGQPVAKWEFEDAWVKSYDPPDLDASADGEVATESITVAFDKMKREEV